MLMKKKLLAFLITGALSCSFLAACGGSSSTETSTSASSASTAEADSSVEADSAAAADSSAEAVESSSTVAASSGTASDGSFSLLDVSSDMIKTGLYAKDDSGNELVFSLFTAPDGNDYVSLFTFDADGTGDVLCGQYTATQKEAGEDGIAWTVLDGTDVYTGNSFSIGVVEADDGSAAFYDQNGTVYTAQYLDADQTITYMGTAAALLANQ
jgi:hypothetical protein